MAEPRSVTHLNQPVFVPGVDVNTSPSSNMTASKYLSRQVGAGGWAAILSFIAGLSYSVYWLATSSKEKAPIESESQVTAGCL